MKKLNGAAFKNNEKNTRQTSRFPTNKMTFETFHWQQIVKKYVF